MIATVTPIRSAPPHPWMQTASGGMFDLTAEDPRQVSIKDIALSLSKICRFNGHCRDDVFYSVAQHSMLVAHTLRKFAPHAQLYGLLHDAHEAYVGDVIRPVKQLSQDMDVYNVRADLEELVQRTIHKALGLPHPVPQDIAEAIRLADEAVLATELRDLMAEPPRSWNLKCGPLPGRAIVPLPWDRAHEKFLAMYEDLSIAAGVDLMAGSAA